MKDEEDLSRLLSGELPEEEARRLRARIAAEPALARSWERMQALPQALAELPLLPAPRVRRPGWRAAALALAAGLVLGLLPSLVGDLHPPQVHVGIGEQLVEGELRALVGALAIDVDGRALISVEPRGGSARGSSTEVPHMNGSHLVAALSGAAITVLVYEGRATITGPDAEAIEVSAGESWSQGERSSPAPGAPPQPKSLAEAVVEIARLREALEKARLEQAVARGQLALETGTPIAWPEVLPEVARPTAWEAALREAMAKSGAGEVVAVDCEEFPCIAAIRAPNAEDGWEKAIAASVGDLAQSRFEGPVAVLNAAHVMDRGQGPEALMGVAIFPPDPDQREAIDTRIRHRMDQMLQDSSESGGDPE